MVKIVWVYWMNGLLFCFNWVRLSFVIYKCLFLFVRIDLVYILLSNVCCFCLLKLLVKLSVLFIFVICLLFGKVVYCLIKYNKMVLLMVLL